jgi:hypothetical protein
MGTSKSPDEVRVQPCSAEVAGYSTHGLCFISVLTPKLGLVTKNIVFLWFALHHHHPYTMGPEASHTWTWTVAASLDHCLLQTDS